MNEYTRLFLHFLHALGETRRVSTSLFGTRLTNVTRAMRARDPDDALAQCSALAVDWSGGTHIGEALARFNRDWSRRVLGQRSSRFSSRTGWSATALIGSRSKWSGWPNRADA